MAMYTASLALFLVDLGIELHYDGGEIVKRPPKPPIVPRNACRRGYLARFRY